MKIKKSKKSKKQKPVKGKKVRKTAGFPELVALTKETDGDLTYYAVHPADYSDINENTVVGLFRFRRAVNVEVMRKVRRTPKE